MAVGLLSLEVKHGTIERGERMDILTGCFLPFPVPTDLDFRLWLPLRAGCPSPSLTGIYLLSAPACFCCMGRSFPWA